LQAKLKVSWGKEKLWHEKQEMNTF